MFEFIRVPPWEDMHPLLVHFPITLLILAPLFILLATSSKKRSLEWLVFSAATVALGTVFLLLSMSTGELAEARAEQVPGASAALEAHENLAYITRNLFLGTLTILSLLCLAARQFKEKISAKTRLITGLTLFALYLIPMSYLIRASHEGARLVHEIGVRAWKKDGNNRSPHSRPSMTGADHGEETPGGLHLPQASDNKARDFKGLHNVVAYAPGVYSGSVPHGSDGFLSLKKMGIQIVISVDGAKPEVALARRYGLKYVHLPIAYNGMNEKRKLEIARAVRDLPHPIYIHCHHGKHRSAAATGSALVTLGFISTKQAVARMKVSGTSTQYPGLYAVVEKSAPATHVQLENAEHSFPEVAEATGLVQTMVEIDQVKDRLKIIEKSGWRMPSTHPDLVPAAEAGKLADLLRNLKDNERVQLKGKAFVDLMLRNAKEAQMLESAFLQKMSGEELTKRWKATLQSCTECHKDYRNE